MIRSGVYLLFFAGIVFLFACKKNKSKTVEETNSPELPSQIKYPDYSALKVGNYWIYQRYELNEDGSYTGLNQFDSSYVEKDTVIRGNTYSKIRRKDFILNGPGFVFLRDSLHYIVSPGGIEFSSVDFTTIFQTFHYVIEEADTIYKSQSKMVEKDLVVTTPAGIFTTNNMQTVYTITPKYTSPGVSNPRYRNMRYAKNIGLITETELFYLSSKRITEKRLIRYKVN